MEITDAVLHQTQEKIGNAISEKSEPHSRTPSTEA